ncbi:DUF3927 family protein [Yersinia sp. 2553 StPb PI]|uniref:DUF3927 family protein n=1 Tax=Yersinia sp. 2553 StPb PI TaxID=3117411 RepID=UPI003FA46F5F
MAAMLDKFRLLAVLVLAFMVIAVDFTSYALSVLGDAFFIGALVLVVWPVLNKKATTETGQ